MVEPRRQWTLRYILLPPDGRYSNFRSGAGRGGGDIVWDAVEMRVDSSEEQEGELRR